MTPVLPLPPNLIQEKGVSHLGSGQTSGVSGGSQSGGTLPKKESKKAKDPEWWTTNLPIHYEWKLPFGKNFSDFFDKTTTKETENRKLLP
eukprot:7755961-Ditylum_brightwellii.AAC.1